MSFFEFITSPIGEKNRIPNFNLKGLSFAIA
jgi:hypothetical protein